MKEYLESIKSFSILTVCFTIVLFCVKIFEILSSGNIIFGGITEMFYSNLIASMFLSSCVFVIYNIISFLSKKTALYISSILFAIIIISEISLIFYYRSTGLMMGNELIERPLWETITTIKSVLNFWMILAAILFILTFTYVGVKMSQKQNLQAKIRKPMVMLVMMLISIPLFFTLKPNQKEDSVNKFWYCVHACFWERNMESAEIILSRLEYDNDMVEKYKALFPDRQISDNEYPLERMDNIDNVLGGYFKKSADKPNVVFIVVESLGADLFGINEYGYTFTPFLDSLSKHSLLWSNCLSTTPRSFGAVPAITGSVPHGLKGFQFGDIPEYNSLFSVLKDNDYVTSAFYAGDYSFDKVYDYLVSQKVDFLAPLLYDQQKKENKHYDYTYWGYQDKPMFERSMQMIEQRDKKNSYFDMFMTVSQHDNRLRLNDKGKADKYYERVSEIISTLPDNEQSKMNEISGHLAATIYGDEAIRDFVKRYSEYNEDGNYIFVITGDHSLNINSDNPLDAFHVPLIIWSPLLEKTARFNSVVSHNDIVPTINALLRDNYDLKTPKEIHWVGEELDTIQDFHCDLKTFFLRYTRNVFDGIYENYYYTFENRCNKAFLIKDNLQFEEITDKELIAVIDDSFKTMIYVDNYAYTNNKITKKPLFSQSDFKLIKEYVIDSVYCATYAEKPSVKKPEIVEILSTKINSQYDEIKVVITADVLYTARVWQDQFINLGMTYTHDNNTKIQNIDNISKNFVGKEHHPDEVIKFEFTKVFSVKDFKDNHFKIYLQPTEKDYLWNPEHTVTLKNVNIMILGNKDSE